MGERKHEHRRSEGSQRRATVDPEATETEEHCAEGCDRRTSRNAENVGIGERIAQQHLHHHPRKSEGRAGGEGAEGA